MANGPTKSSVFRLCTIVTFVVAAGLTFCSVFSVWRFTAHDMADWDVDHGTYWNALTYFDSNRNADAILDVQTVSQDSAATGFADATYAAQHPCQGPTTNPGTTASPGVMDYDREGITGRTALTDTTRVANTEWSALTNLGTWRGTVAGCENSDDATNIIRGVCNGNSMTTGTDVAAQGSVQLNRWRSKKYFCVLTTVQSKYQETDTAGCPDSHPLNCGDHCFSAPTNWPGATTASSGSALCPMTEMKLVASTTTTAVTGKNGQALTKGWQVSGDPSAATHVDGDMDLYYQRLTAAQDASSESWIPESIGLAVEWYGKMCVDPALSPADPSQNYPLMASSGAGCGKTLGEDDMSDEMDSMREWDFLTANSEVVGDNPDTVYYAQTAAEVTAGTAKVLRDPTRTAASTTKMADVIDNNKLKGYNGFINAEQSFKVNLMNRRRILTRSSIFCDGFRFNSQQHAGDATAAGTNQKHASTLLAQFDTIWDLVKWLAIVSTSTAVLAVMMVLLVVLDGSDRQTQTYMTMMYCICLVGLFCSVVLMWKARYLIANNYNLPFQHFTKASDKDQNCITSATWNNLLTLWINGTSFGGLETQLLYCLILFVVMLVVAVIFAIWALMKLAKVAGSRKRNL